MYMTSHDFNWLHMYLYPEEDDEDENEDDENGDKDGDAEMEEDDGPLEPVPRDRLVMADVMSQMTNEMYAAYIRQLWYMK